ncbi:MAG TPA: hypothetical protein VHT01_07845 [Candidatus Udaeobacter sp.]|nr:hypothetical protein [Candidatus Udaeobacter sp.]
MNHRLKHFESVYNLRFVIDAPKKRPYLEILAELGVARPSLIRGLLQIRNDVEYNDAAPPQVERCREFVDILWYLLRSTDAMLHTARTGLMLTPPDADPWDSVYWCSLDIRYSPIFGVTISGWVPGALASASEKVSYLAIQAESFHTKVEKWVRLRARG